MTKRTYLERLVAGLKATGYEQCRHQPSTKYLTFQKPGSTNFTYVGKFGALRHGVTIKSSYSIGCPTGPSEYFKKLLQAGDEALAKETP